MTTRTGTSKRKGLVLYGYPAVGKSTLEMNLRKYYFGTALTQDSFQTDGVRCFLGKTAKKDNRIMSTGGAESLTTLDGIPDVPMYVAAIPVTGRHGIPLAIKFMQGLDEVRAICLYTQNQREYRNKRTVYFSGRESRAKHRGGRLVHPPFVDRAQCSDYPTELLLQAMCESIQYLGEIPKDLPERIVLLEEFDAVPASETFSANTEAATGKLPILV